MLWCLSCKRPTLHLFAETVKVDSRTLDVMYECMMCSTHRLYGRENPNGAPSED